uniref:Uncharacterized protein n=2 Tax=Oryza brachyantha TaxID=4533 RepID=J3KUW6_ORYBR
MLSTPRPGQCHRRFELSKAIWGKGIAPAPAKSPDELRRRYPDLVDTVERISAAECQGRAGNALKRGLGFIDDTTAGRLNSLAKKQRCLEIKMMLKRHDLRKRVLSKRIKIID